MEILAHRGLPFEYPENTLISFEESLKCGFGIETDIRRTKDNILVLCHDRNILRATGVDATIGESTLKDLKGLSFKYFHKNANPVSICTLEELVELYKKYSNGKKVALHVKVDEATKETLADIASIIKRKALSDFFFIFDLTLETAKEFKNKFPDVHVSISVGEKKYAPSIYLLEDVKGVEYIDSVWADEWKEKLYFKEFFEKIKKMGKSAYVISPELHSAQNHPLSVSGYEVLWEELIDWKVAGICTDFPKRLKGLEFG